jgi:hypothetical protein
LEGRDLIRQVAVHSIGLRNVSLFRHADQGQQQRPGHFDQKDTGSPDGNQTVGLRRQARQGLLACEQRLGSRLGTGCSDQALGELLEVVVSGEGEIFTKGHGNLCRPQ